MLEKLRDFIRPLTVAALVAVLIIGATVAGVLEVAVPGQGVAFTLGVAGWFKAIPGNYYNLAMAALLGYGAARTVDKGVKAFSKAKYGSAKPDIPEGDV